MGVELPERVTFLCDLYQEEAVQAFEVLQDAGFSIAVGHFKGSTGYPEVFAGEYSAYGLDGIRHFANTFGPIYRELYKPSAT